MKHIVKGAEPPGLLEFKAAENEDWKPRYDNLTSEAKVALKSSLMREQGWLCCYCEIVVMLEALAPDRPEDARPYPGLETQMAGAAGTVFARHHLPLAPRPQDVEDAVHDRAVGYTRAPVQAWRLVQRQDRFDHFPQVIRYLAESTPPFLCSTHRMALPDLTMILAGLTSVDREGF